MHLQRHALLHTGIHRLISPIILIFRSIFCEFHHRIISEIILFAQKSNHSHHVVTQIFTIFIHILFRVIHNGIFQVIHRIFNGVDNLIQHQRQRILAIIGRSILGEQEIRVDGRLGHLHRSLYQNLIKRSESLECLLINSVSLHLIIWQASLRQSIFHQDIQTDAVGSHKGCKG